MKNLPNFVRVTFVFLLLLSSSLASEERGDEEITVLISPSENGGFIAKVGSNEVAIEKADVDLMKRLSHWINEDARRQIRDSEDGVDRDFVALNKVYGGFSIVVEGGSSSMLIFNERGDPLSVSFHEVGDRELREGFREILIRILSKAALNNRNPGVPGDQ
ncbi:MAG: hypothetical protein MUF31_11615 [Akkermansiaceae bacterium]|jgi:hypothetical protein|nr:hypothetical protein [Akkermansiaceae bacterium]